MIFDAFEAMVFYSAYHQNKINQYCHIVCVPLIWLTAVSFLTMSIDYPVQWIIYCIYIVVYLTLEPLALVLFLPVFHLLTMGGVALPHYLPFIGIFALHAFAWIAQIYTHQVYEKRAPALIDNIVQALVMAPFFVWLEVLFMFNYRPALRKELQVAAAKKISQMNKEKQAKTK